MKCYIINSFLLWLIINLVTASDIESVTVSTKQGTKTGFINNNIYELESDNGNNEATFHADGSFSCSFQNTSKGLCKFGMPFDKVHTPYKYLDYRTSKPMYVTFQLDKFEIKNETNDNYYANVGVRSWSNNGYDDKVIAIYEIIENWIHPFPNNSTHSGSFVKVGDYVVDDSEYTVYKRTDFREYKSYRKEKRTSGKVDVSSHFNHWEMLNLLINGIDEVSAFVSLGTIANDTTDHKINGSFDITSSKVYFGERDSKCPIKIQELGYICCSEDCEVIYTDQYGAWGFENTEWCGCGPTTNTTISNPTTTSVTTSTDTSSVTVVGEGNGTLKDKSYSFDTDEGYNYATFNEDGSFSCHFRNTHQAICMYSLDYGKTLEQMGQITIDYNLETPIRQNIGNSQTEIIGNAYKEEENYSFSFYIVEDYSYVGLFTDFTEKVGEFNIDGGIYLLYSYVGSNLFEWEKSIHRVYSIRKTPRKSGTIHINDHIKIYESLGFKIGKINYLKLFTENYSVNAIGNRRNIYADFNFKKFNISIENDYLFKCSPSIRRKGYGCCSSTCKTLYSDDDGNWGIENGEWCGCQNEGEVDPKCPWKVIGLGYKCCTGDCEVIEVDENGQWAVQNDEWCGCY